MIRVANLPALVVDVKTVNAFNASYCGYVKEFFINQEGDLFIFVVIRLFYI